MRVVVAVDWSDQAFTAVQDVIRLYTPQELTLVHAVDLGVLESPLLAPAMAKQAYKDFRRAMMDAGQQLLDQTAALVPTSVASVRRVCEFGSPAHVILNAAQSASADVVVVGSRGRGRLVELVLGSVSHRVLAHATCSTLVVKGLPIDLRRVLLAVEGPEDADRLQRWLRAHPFNKPVELVVMSVVPTPQFGEPRTVQESWGEAAMEAAQGMVDAVAGGLSGPSYSPAGQVFRGDPAERILLVAARCDLVVVGSHGRKGLDRFLLGSVSHSVAHRAACPVLVVRETN